MNIYPIDRMWYYGQNSVNNNESGYRILIYPRKTCEHTYTNIFKTEIKTKFSLKLFYFTSSFIFDNEHCYGKNINQRNTF